MKTLTVHNAEIHTATVEIRTLTISGKQVTLAVFRQLEQVNWLDANGDPRGMPWGRVNYCPGGACWAQYVSDGWGGTERNGWHLHLVWQSGTELRRYAFPYPPSRRPVADLAVQENRDAAYKFALQLPQLFIAV